MVPVLLALATARDGLAQQPRPSRSAQRPAAQPAPAAQTGKPNVVVIFVDDLGWFNLSAYNRGMMGYHTPNIDRIANEGMLFTDAYAEQSCTAGRAAFITGQSGIRTGLLKVGLPGSDLGLQPEDPTIAELLRPQGYTSGQFGKNHLGDKDEFLPTVHGFDEFFGNLYHLNAEEEPENEDYPRDSTFRQRFGPRGVLHSYANPDGTQRIENTGPLTRQRMETVDNEFLQGALHFVNAAVQQNKPFFLWFNTTRMHIWTHLPASYSGRTGFGLYADGLTQADDQVGTLLNRLDSLGIANNTIVIFSSDNGAELMSWPDGGMLPFRGEKNTNWEGGYRVPLLVRWPGVVRPGTVSNEIVAHQDWLPTILAAAGQPDVTQRLLQGYQAGSRTYRVHLDGYNILPYLRGDTTGSPRREFFYWNDDGQLVALRYDRWKLVFQEQRTHGFDVWQEPFVTLRLPKLFDLRADPFERADHETFGYDRWRLEHVYLLMPAQAFVGQFLATLRDYPPRQRPESFNLDAVMEQLRQPSGGRN
jgi:arylsulfatase